jgi:hypothetical protein
MGGHFSREGAPQYFERFFEKNGQNTEGPPLYWLCQIGYFFLRGFKKNEEVKGCVDLSYRMIERYLGLCVDLALVRGPFFMPKFMCNSKKMNENS